MLFCALRFGIGLKGACGLLWVALDGWMVAGCFGFACCDFLLYVGLARWFGLF